MDVHRSSSVGAGVGLPPGAGDLLGEEGPATAPVQHPAQRRHVQPGGGLLRILPRIPSSSQLGLADWSLVERVDLGVSRFPCMASGPGELMGPYEVAAYLGVTRQRFQQIARRPSFPAPYQELRGMKVYLAAEIRDWAKANRPPRRPDEDEPA